MKLKLVKKIVEVISKPSNDFEVVHKSKDGIDVLTCQHREEPMKDNNELPNHICNVDEQLEEVIVNDEVTEFQNEKAISEDVLPLGNNIEEIKDQVDILIDQGVVENIDRV